MPLKKRRFQYQAKTQPVFVPEDIAKATHWFQWFAEPVRLKVGLTPHLQQSHIEPVTVPEDIPRFGWSRSLSEPVRQKVGLGSYAQQAFAWDSQQISAEQIFADKWWHQWENPRSKAALPTGEQLAWIGPATVPEDVPRFNWRQILSEPLRIKRSVPTDQSFVPATDSFAWFAAFAEPVRSRRQIDVPSPFVPVVAPQAGVATAIENTAIVRRVIVVAY